MTQDEALRKAMACLRLAKSSNPNEAALAAAKAQEIIDRYQLDVSSLDYDAQQKKRDDEPIKNFESDPLDDVEGINVKWAGVLAVHVARNNQCRVYLQDGLRGKVLKIIGRASDVSAVRYMYSFLKEEVKRLRKENAAGHSGPYMNQFAHGVVDTIAAKLKQQREATFNAVKAEQANNNLALVRVNNAVAKIKERMQAVDKFVEENMRFRKSRASTSSYAGMGGREHGRKEGHKVRLGGAKGAVGRGVAGELN